MQVYLALIYKLRNPTDDKIHLAFKDCFFLNVKNEVYSSDVHVEHNLLL